MSDKSSLKERIAKTLYAERLMNKMSQSELAEKIGTTKSNISRVERGKQNVSANYIEAIADALDKDAELVFSDRRVSYGDTEVYSLKLFDEELLRFRMERKASGLKAKVLEVNEEKKQLLPLDLEPDGEGILKWLERRSIPSNRELVEDILAALDLDAGDVKGIVDICFALSLNDSYWVVPYGSDVRFSEYNLYENRFNETLSLIAYAGYGETSKKFMTTPELTTGGMLRKAWRYKGDDGIWLYKSGTDGFANTGNEPYSEFYASQIAEKMGLNAVRYDLERWCHILASRCRLFTNKDTSFVPIGRIVKSGGIDACIDYYKKLGSDYYQELASMLCFDTIIMNEDRHYGNFGVLRNNHTGNIIAPAPIFDNGVSLLCYATREDFDKGIGKYIEERTNPYGYGNNYFDLAKRVMGPRQKREIKRLIGFRFAESDVSDLPAWRLRAIEGVVQERVKKLLSL